MGSTNIWKRFKGLLPAGNRYVATVLSKHSNGICQVQLRDGSVVVVDGESVTVGSRVFIGGGKVMGTAPDLAQHESTV